MVLGSGGKGRGRGVGQPSKAPAIDLLVELAREPASGPLLALLEEVGAEPLFPATLRALWMRQFEAPLPPMMVIGVSDEDAAESLRRRLLDSSEIRTAYVEPGRAPIAHLHLSSVGGSSSMIDQWGLDAIRWEHARRGDASQVRVGVVDTGIDRGHPELMAAIASCTDYTATGDTDTEGHGTHVAGIIAATGTRPHGIAGTSNARLCVYKAFAPRAAPRAYLRALGFALAECRVVNLSMAGKKGRLEAELISRAASATVVVAAVGNTPDTSYPGMLPDVIAVGAVDRALRHAPFSNTGRHVTLAAPGVTIWSTSPRSGSQRASTYDSSDGTSMAAPFVAGAAALVLAANPRLTPAEVANALKTQAIPPSGRNDELGRGVLDLEKTLSSVPPP